MRTPRTLALVLAGGKGSRLAGLTEHRPKPTLPIGGTYTLIDVVLSNLAHSHLTDVGIVEQYLPRPLNAYLANGRPWDLDRTHGGLIVLPPFEGEAGAGFATGNADALDRQRAFIRSVDPDVVLVLSADHLYTCDYSAAIAQHARTGADLTIVTTEIAEDAGRYGVVEVDADGRVTRFDYKPDDPSGHVVATEAFVYSTSVLLDTLAHLRREHGQLDDYGDQLVPYLVEHADVRSFRHEGYWLDLGTLQSYWTANLQLLDREGATLDDPEWPIWTAMPQLPPARVLDGAALRDAWVAPGSEVAGEVERSVVGPNARIDAGATVRDSVLLDGVHVGPGVSLVNCIVDADADVTGGSVRGSEDVVTLIGRDGTIDERAPFDHQAALPRRFAR